MDYNLDTTPVVRDIRTAEMLAGIFPAVVTAGPNHFEVDWNHPNHHVEVFPDIVNPKNGPQIDQVERMIQFGAENNGPILVHCHAGVSRSTATAIGIAMARGADAGQAVDMIHRTHPEGHEFWPNGLILFHLESIFRLPQRTFTDLVKNKTTYLSHAR